MTELSKPDLILGISTLLSLSKEATKELTKLNKATLEEIFYNYKENAINANNAIEAEAKRARQHATAPCRRKNSCKSQR